jgi:hypothetical protein
MNLIVGLSIMDTFDNDFRLLPQNKRRRGQRGIGVFDDKSLRMGESPPLFKRAKKGLFKNIEREIFFLETSQVGE